VKAGITFECWSLSPWLSTFSWFEIMQF
jgi:hypothetical protein